MNINILSWFNFQHKSGSSKKPKGVNPLRAKRKQNIRQFLSKTSGSFFIVIALMPLAGILLGVGASITSYISQHGGSTTSAGYVIGNLLSQSGGFLFTNLGFFFAIAVVIGFTKDWKAAISAVWAYFLFNAIQAAMLGPTLLSYIGNANAPQHFSFWFYKSIPTGALASNVGIGSFSTGVIGGLIVATIVVYCYNRWKNIKLPGFFAFFSGSRFVPFACTFYMFILAFIILLLWPAIAVLLNVIGAGLQKLPLGVGVFIYAYIWRALTPIGIHHAFYTIFWFTSVGGSLDPNNVWIHNPTNGVGGLPAGAPIQLIEWIHDPRGGGDPSFTGSLNGDNPIWFNMERWNLSFNTQFFPSKNDVINNTNVLGIHPGQYIGPNYPIMIGGATGSFFAMWAGAKQEHKKKVAAIMGSAWITSLAIGVTEPWLWSYILVAPILFFGFHSIMTGLGAFLMNILGAHVGAAFSCGLLDLVIYGALPYDLSTGFYWVLVISLLYIPIYYFVFRYYMVWKKVVYPVIESDVVFSSKEKVRAQSNVDLVVINLIKGLGGKENIKSLFNCATRVRVDVNDSNKIDIKLLNSTGAFKVLKLGNNVQVIYGPKAESIANRAIDYLKELEANEASKKQVV